MPRMSGLELTGKLRADGSFTPILPVPGSSSPGTAARAKDLGRDGVFEKPPDDEELLDVVNRH